MKTKNSETAKGDGNVGLTKKGQKLLIDLVANLPKAVKNVSVILQDQVKEGRKVVVTFGPFKATEGRKLDRLKLPNYLGSQFFEINDTLKVKLSNKAGEFGNDNREISAFIRTQLRKRG